VGQDNGPRFKDRTSGVKRMIWLAGVFVHVGLVPNTEFLTGTVELSRHAEILVDARCATGVPGCSRRAIRRPCPRSRSSSPRAIAPRRRCRPSTT
jgi:hypothetical protein